MLTSAYNNGVSETRAYNNDNTLASINFTGAPIGNLSYNWDANKNKTSEGITGTMSGYGFDVGTSGYDDEDRLVAWNRDDNNLDQAWNLSLVGDWNSVTENASTQSRTHGPTHELLTAAGQAITHDAKGNQTILPAMLRPGSDPLSLQWDFENKLISADTDNDSVADATYQWDALGRRVGRDDGTTVTVFVQSGQQTIADYTSGTAAASPTYNYVYASYIDEPVMRAGTGGLRYYHRNQQYSITALTSGGGAVTERYAYSAYGTPTITDAAGTARTTSAEDNRYLYTGREWDENLDLYHYRARMYDPVSGRFCSRDPIGYWFSTNNLYSYTNASPLIWMDFTGMCPNTDDDEEEDKGPCKGKEIDPEVTPTIELCKTIFKAIPLIKDPTDICKYCKKLPGGDFNPVKKLCKEACKKVKKLTGVPSLKGEIIEVACCSGTLPDGVPSAKCVAKMFEGGPVPNDRAVLQCTTCCSTEHAGNFTAISNCRKACLGNAGGR